MNLLAISRETSLPKKVVSRTVVCDDLAVSQFDWLGDGDVQARLSWEEIAAVHAYKRDCFSVDQIRVALSDRSDRVRIDISEDDGGYQVLVEELPRRLAGCLRLDEWYQRVALPPFETQMTELYRRPCAVE
jgi:hypothetical protein